MVVLFEFYSNQKGRVDFNVHVIEEGGFVSAVQEAAEKSNVS